MKYRISNDFKERLLKGEITNNFDVNLYAVNSHFKNVYDTDDLAFEQFRRLSEFNIFSHNNFRTASEYNKNCLSACMFDYLTMPVAYSAYYNNDVADKPLFVNAENWEIFRSVYLPIEGEDNMERLHAYLDENSRDFADRNGGFYYVQEKSQIKWIANRVNNEYDFNNKLIIVLGDDLGGIGVPEEGHDEREYYTELDFCICPVADHPFNGVFDLNGHTINMFNVICSDYSNGVIGYLGEHGVVCNGRIGKLVFENRKKISLQTIKTENTDIFVGGLVGTNYGIVNNIETFDMIEFRGFMPEVYLVQNKEEYAEGADTIKEESEANVFWPDRFCLNSPWNTIPYVGYFVEGADSYFNSRLLGDGASWDNHRNQAYHEIKRVVHNFYDTKNFELYHAGDSNSVFHRDNYADNWGMLKEAEIPIAQQLDNGNKYTKSLFDQYKANHSDLSDAGGNFMRSLLVAHAAECAINVSSSGNKFLHQDNWRVFFHKRMNKNGRNAYYCSPIVGTNFGTISNVNAYAQIVESNDTFVGFIGLVTGKHNKGVIRDVNVRMSVNENRQHRDTMRTYKNSQQFDGEGLNRAFGYYYHRDMNINDKNTSKTTFRIPKYSTCYLDANAGPSGPDWKYTKTSGYNWFHQMGTHEYDYCNWFVREDKREEAMAAVRTSGYNWVTVNNGSYIGKAFKDDAVVKAATSNAMKLHMKHTTVDTQVFSKTEQYVAENSDFALTLFYTPILHTRDKATGELDYKTNIRFYDTRRIESDKLPLDEYSENRIISIKQLNGKKYKDCNDVFAKDDLGVPDMNFNSFKSSTWSSNALTSALDFDVVEFNLEYLTNNYCHNSHNSDILYCESSKTYSASAFEAMQIDKELEPDLYNVFSDTSGVYYVLNSAYSMSCSARAHEIDEQLMLQGIALGAQSPFHIAHPEDSEYMNWGSSGPQDNGKQLPRIWGDPGYAGGNSTSIGFLGINDNKNCKHDWYINGTPDAIHSNLPSVRSTMATITVDNSTLPDAFIDKIKTDYISSLNHKTNWTNTDLTDFEKFVYDNAKVQIEKIYVPIWNTSTNKRREKKIGDSDYYRNYIYFSYNNSNDKETYKDDKENLINWLNVSLTDIHFNILIPEKLIDVAGQKEVLNYNRCQIVRGILELPTVTFDVPICITHAQDKPKSMRIENVTYEEHKNVFLNIKEYNDAIEKGETLPPVKKDTKSIPKYSNGLESPSWSEECVAQKVDVFLEVAPYSMDEIATSENLQYHMPSIYNIGGIAGMYAPTFVGPDYSQCVSDYGAGRHHAIKNCNIIVEPETKEFVERSLYASIKGRVKTDIIVDDPGKEANYAALNNSDLYVANKFAGIAPIVELNAGDMGVFPGGFQKWKNQDGSAQMIHPHPDYMRIGNRFANSVKDVVVVVKPYSYKNNGQYVTTSRINNQFFSNYFNWINHSMAFDSAIGAYQLTTANDTDKDAAFIFGVNWDQPNPLAPMLGRHIWENPCNSFAIYDSSRFTSPPKKGCDYQHSFAEYAATGRYPNDYDDQKSADGGTMTNGWGTCVVNTVKLFGDYQTPKDDSTFSDRSWNNRSMRQCFARHYEVAAELLMMERLQAFEPTFINPTDLKITWGRTIKINDIYMSPMMNSFSDSTDLYQPMYAENSNFCNMKMARPVMCAIARNYNIADDYVPLTDTFDNYSVSFENLDSCLHFADKGEVKDNVFTYDYEFGNATHHEIEKPALTGNIHYNKQRFLFKQDEGEVYMPITRKGKYNDGSVLHLGLVPTASALPSLISESELGVYRGSVAVSGHDLAGFVITDQAEDPNVIGMLDFERSVNLNSGAFVYQYNKVIQEDDEQKYGLLVEVK